MNTKLADHILPYIFNHCADEITPIPRVHNIRKFSYYYELLPILYVIFNQSLLSSLLPNDWQKANVWPVYKKGNHMHSNVANDH